MVHKNNGTLLSHDKIVPLFLLINNFGGASPNCGVRIRLLGQHLTFVHKNLPVFRRESMSIKLFVKFC